MIPSRILLLCALAATVIVVAALTSDNGWSKARHQEEELARLEGRADALRAKNATLEAEAERLKGTPPQDPGYAEQVVRTELGWIRPGERVVQLPAAEN